MKVGTVGKETPRDSILGPFIFNLFQNYLIVKLECTSDAYDNTIAAAAKALDGVSLC